MKGWATGDNDGAVAHSSPSARGVSALLSRAFRLVRDLLFGYDVFISYAWSDGRAYAQALANTLREKGYRCFLDDQDMASGSELDVSINVALRRSSALVAVATPAALASTHVAKEIRRFSQFRRHMVPVFLDPELRRIGGGSTLSLLRERLWIDEVIGPLLEAPSQDLLKRLIQTFRFVRRNRIRTTALAAAVLVFAILAAVAWLQLYRVETARRLSEAQVLARTQPTEAFLMLAETRGRWFADESLLPQLSSALVAAPLTIKRHLIGDAVSGVIWLPDGYAAGSADGRANVWDRNGNLLSLRFQPC